jgi:hypothetical protein
LDVVTYERNVYTFLNFLGDVGALYSVVTTFASLVLFKVLQLDIIWENHVIANVFRAREGEDPVKVTRLEPTYFQALKLKLCSMWICKDSHSKAKKRKVLMRRIGRELDVSNFIRRQIILSGILKALTTK